MNLPVNCFSVVLCMFVDTELVDVNRLVIDALAFICNAVAGAIGGVEDLISI